MHKYPVPPASYSKVKGLFETCDRERNQDTSSVGTSESEQTKVLSRPSFSMDDLVPETLRNIPKRTGLPADKNITKTQTFESPEPVKANSQESKRKEEDDNFVKFQSDTSSFEDIRSVAVNSWGNGIDLKLKKDDKKTKKSNWLSQNEFFATSTTSNSNGASGNGSGSGSGSSKATTTTTTTTTTFDSNNENTQEQTPKAKDAPEASLSQQKNTYANIAHSADRNVPSWAPDPNFLEKPVINHHRLPKSNKPAVRGQFILRPESSQAKNGIIPMAAYSKDLEVLKLLHCILTFQENTQVINTFYKRVDSILRRAHEYSGRIFTYLLQVLALLIEPETSIQSSRPLSPKVMQYWNQIKTGCLTYIQFYIALPKDLTILLKFLATLSVTFPTHPNEFDLPLLDNSLENVKDVATNIELNEINKLLQRIRNPNLAHEIEDLDEPIPPIPTASIIVNEALNGTNSFNDYESQHQVQLVNTLQRMDPTLSLPQYLTLHYMLIREEMMGPLRETVKYVKGLNLESDQPIPQNNLFRHTIPRNTVLTMTSTQVAILFELTSIYNSDTLMECLTEGTLTLLLPEREQQDKPFAGALLGQVIRFTTTKKRDHVTTIVAIQLLRVDTVIDWSCSYTLAAYKCNASTYFAVLNWLRNAFIDFKKEDFSSILTPRLIAADNVLTPNQLQEWCGSQVQLDQLSANESQVPSYMRDVELDIACVLVRNKSFIAIPSKNSWPRHNSKWESVSPSRRQPIYTLSPSQVSALQFALTHRIAVISGPAGTGKTFLAGKLIQLISEALHKGQFHQPVLLITKSQSGLDSILTQIVPHMHDIVRFGGQPWDDSLIKKQATKLSTSSSTDPNRKQQQHIERQLLSIQAKLSTLFNFRAQVLDHDPNIFCSVIAPSYADVMREEYRNEYVKVSHTITNYLLWNRWITGVEDESSNKINLSSLNNAQWKLTNDHQARTGTGLMPIMDEQTYQARHNWIESHSTPVLPIPDASNWPFPQSTRLGEDLRSDLLDCWRLSAIENIWHIDDVEKEKIVNALTKVLLSYIDSEINRLMDEQTKESAGVDDSFIQKCVYFSRFNRVVGMTADFAAVHRDWISKLWPHVVIVDEASQIHESVVMSSLLGPRVEHVVIFGNSDSSFKPTTINEDIAGAPRNLGVSLFERWKVSGGKMIRLEEQWRMHSEVASIIDSFSGRKNDKELLITAPLTTGIDNKMDGRDGSKEVLYGLTQRTYYVNYQTDRSDHGINNKYSGYLRTQLTNAEIDEARYVAHLAVYITQQPYSIPQVTVLTLTVQQKYIIRRIIREEIPTRTCFNNNASSIVIDSVEQNAGRENSFVIISTATPGKSNSTINNVALALTRARYGLIIVGKPGVDKLHSRWNDLAEDMKKRELFGSSLMLTCHTHAETAMMSHWTDFMQMKNGGCSQKCMQLMTCGHVCPEVCHFLKHDEVICNEPCIRTRPQNCQHMCANKCYECTKNGSCPPCREEATVELPCKHQYTGICSSLQNIETIQCHELVDVVLSCGHTKSVECYRSSKPGKIECDVSTTTTLECGHVAEVKCGITPVCTSLCKKELECGHLCRRMCGANHSHDRRYCTANCTKQLICGHYCAKGCANPNEHTERCSEKCNYVCSHGYTCSRECWRDCIKCVSKCPYECEHFKCTKQCYEKCDRPACNAPCKKRLRCSHKCSGLCGERCPPCHQCNPDLQCAITLRNLHEFEANERSYILPECGCVFSVDALDQYFNTQVMNGKHTAIRLWGCPSCSKTIYTALRYNAYIKTEIALVNTIKQKMEKERQKLTNLERTQIIEAMNTEIDFAIHNVVGGRWFVCENQHPYYIGECGGATEVSQCPECGAVIGGLQHKVIETNRFYGEFDGSEQPAWPGQPGQPDQPDYPSL